VGPRFSLERCRNFSPTGIRSPDVVIYTVLILIVHLLVVMKTKKQVKIKNNK